MKDKENKLIALFMGLQEDGVDGYLVDMNKDYGYQIVHESCFLYHSSWDWLMPVVLKIENGGLDPHELIDKALYNREIEDLHDACVTLIKAYNNERQ